MNYKIQSSLILPIAAAILAVNLMTVSAKDPASATTGASVAVPQAEEILKSLNKSHPRLMLSADTPQRIKDLVAQDAVAKSVYDEIMASANKALKEKPETYRLPDGRRLLSISSSVFGRVQSLAFAYLMTKDKKYLDRAWAELEAAGNFKDWNPPHFLDVAVMTGAFAIGYDWLWNDWTPEQRAFLENAIAEKGLKPALKAHASGAAFIKGKSNWNQVCNGGVGLGALAIGDLQPDLAGKVLEYGIARLPNMMETFAPDGGGEEGLGYWDFGSRYNILLMASMDSALGTDFGLSQINGFKQSGDFQIYMSGAGRTVFDFSDCGLNKCSAPQHFWMAQKYDLPRYAWFRYSALKDGQGGNIFDLIWFDLRGKNCDPAQMPLDRHFREAEKVSLRDSWQNDQGFIVGIEGGPNHVSHSHIDGGTFILETDGVRWIIDSGKEDQTYQKHSNNAKRTDFYRVRAEGHNTLVMNPDASPGQAGDAVAVFTKFDSQKDRATAVMDLTSAYDDKAEKVTRTYELERGKSFTVTDDVVCKQPTDIWSFFHTDSNVTLSADKRTATFKKKGKSLTATLESPANATFEVLPAEPGKDSPVVPSQASNKGRCKLTVHLDGVEKATVSVRFER